MNVQGEVSFSKQFIKGWNIVSQYDNCCSVKDDQISPEVLIDKTIVYLCFADYGFYKMECKTKTSAGVEFTTNGSHNHDSGKINGSLETKYKWSEYGTCQDTSCS